ncbi:MAG: GNAT family N-acetyltransferase [Pseudooceanicola nanhaiensis]
MLAAAEGFARAQGCTRMRLWTHESHAAACALYAREGWRRGPRCPVHNYGQDLVEVRWDKDLAEIALPD